MRHRCSTTAPLLAAGCVRPGNRVAIGQRMPCQRVASANGFAAADAIEVVADTYNLTADREMVQVSTIVGGNSPSIALARRVAPWSLAGTIHCRCTPRHRAHIGEQSIVDSATSLVRYALDLGEVRV